MNLFRFFKEHRQTMPRPAFLVKMARQLERGQRRVAVFLQHRSAKLSQRMIYILLVTFCVGYASVCLLIMLGKDRSILKLDRIEPTEHIGRAINRHMPFRDSARYQRVKIFAHYFDSLRRTAGGERFYDSLIAHRPGLVDSLHAVLQYYQ